MEERDLQNSLMHDDLVSKGCDLAECGDFEGAISFFQQALEGVPGKAQVHEMLAQCLLEVGRSDAAIGSATTAVRMDPEVWHIFMASTQCQVCTSLVLTCAAPVGRRAAHPGQGSEKQWRFPGGPALLSDLPGEAHGPHFPRQLVCSTFGLFTICNTSLRSA
jgi:tetratricopeptide (TPR) repeat protein